MSQVIRTGKGWSASFGLLSLISETFDFRVKLRTSYAGFQLSHFYSVKIQHKMSLNPAQKSFRELIFFRFKNPELNFTKTIKFYGKISFIGSGLDLVLTNISTNLSTNLFATKELRTNPIISNAC